MKQLYITLAAAVAATFAIATTSAVAASGEQTSTTYKDVSSYTIEQKNEAVTWLEGRVDALDQKMEELDQKMENAGDAMSKKWKEVKVDLAAKREAAAADLTEFKESTADAWDSTKESVIHSMQNIEDAYDAAADELTK